MTHLLYTRDTNGTANFYIDGVLSKTRTISGNTSNWDDEYDLLLANETSGSRPWLGTYDLVAIFDRALTPTEATQNHNAGPS